MYVFDKHMTLHHKYNVEGGLLYNYSLAVNDNNKMFVLVQYQDVRVHIQILIQIDTNGDFLYNYSLAVNDNNKMFVLVQYQDVRVHIQILIHLIQMETSFTALEKKIKCYKSMESSEHVSLPSSTLV